MLLIVLEWKRFSGGKEILNIILVLEYFEKSFLILT
jgi:hypothetical protein